MLISWFRIFVVVSALANVAIAGSDSSCSPLVSDFYEVSTWILEEFLAVALKSSENGAHEDEIIQALIMDAEKLLQNDKPSEKDKEILTKWVNGFPYDPLWEDFRTKIWKCVIELLNLSSCQALKSNLDELSTWIRRDFATIIVQFRNAGSSDDQLVKELENRAREIVAGENANARDKEILKSWLNGEILTPKWEINIKFKIWKCVIEILFRG